MGNASPTHDLFAPSLEARPVDPGFSQQASFFVAFFGGPFAALLFAAWNARIWGRFDRDLPLSIALGVLSAAGLVALLAWTPDLEAAGYSRRTLRLVPRALGLVIWAVFALRHRELYRMQTLSQLAPRSPWRPALVCIAVATVFTLALSGLASLRWALE